MTKASIVIPSRGGAERLPRLLTALAAQTHHDWEAIVVIDGDIDNSAAVVAQYSHLPVRSIAFPANRGRVSALNAGFAVATGEVLIRCDDDFEPTPGHVAAHVEPHEERVCGVVGLPVNVAPPSAYMRTYGFDADRRGHAAASAMEPDMRWRLWGGNVSVTRAVYDRVGGYDPRYRGYGWEDVDFGYRLHMLGVPIVIAEGAQARHHMAAVTTVIRTGRAMASGRARWTFDSIHGPGSSGPDGPGDSSAWNRTINQLAAGLTENRSAHLAAVIDILLPMLPAPVARKVVAAVVEASSVVGYRRARDAAMTPGQPAN